MPSPSDFRKAFELGFGEQLGADFVIASSSVGHDVKVQNEKYEFPTTLEVDWAKDDAKAGKGLEKRRRALEAAFKKQTGKGRIVYSAYGSPYECAFVGAPQAHPLDEDGRSFKLAALGRATRRRDIPTKAQEKAQEREQEMVQEVTKAEEERWLGGYRVIKSRFGSSKCSHCGQTIDPGVKIAKKDDSSRGGWAHATCLVQQMRGDGGSHSEEEEEEVKGMRSRKAEAEAPAAGRKRSRGGGRTEDPGAGSKGKWQRQQRAPAAKPAAGGKGKGAAAGGSRKRGRRAAAEE